MSTSRINNDLAVAGSVGIGTGMPDSKSILDLTSTTKGLLPPRMTEVERDAIASPSTGLVIYNTTANQLNIYNGSAWVQAGGGGQGGINYISQNNGNPDFESATTGWSTYADLAGVLPVDGTGGTPSHLTITRTTTNPLRGTGSLLITNSGTTSAQGEGVSFPFTIDRADLAKPLAISFDYEVVSGTYSGGSSTTDSDLEVYIYDVTNSQVIQPSGYKITGAVAGVQYKHTGSSFQSASNSSSYLLVLHVPTTSTSAWSIKLDNISVGPQATVLGAPVTDWKAFTSTISNVTTSMSSFYYRRVGDSMEVKGTFIISGIPTSYIVFTLPTGYNLDESRNPLSDYNGIQSYGGIGFAQFTDVSADKSYIGRVSRNANSTNTFLLEGSGEAAWASTAQGIAVASGDGFFVHFVVPIQGWASTVQISNDTDTRVVAARAKMTTAMNSITGSGTQTTVAFNSIDYDSHSGFDTSGQYSIKIPGYYECQYTVQFGGYTVGTYIRLRLQKNGVDQNENYTYCVTGQTDTTLNGIDTVYCNAGDVLRIQAGCGSATYGITVTLPWNKFAIKRISGPSAIAASESVNASYQNTAGTAVSTTATTIPFATKIFDSHGAMTGATGIFKAPITAKFQANTLITLNALTLTTTQGLVVDFWKNGAFYRNAMTVYGNGASTNYRATGVIQISCNAGDTISVAVSLLGAASGSLYSGAGFNYFDVIKVGN